MSKYPIILLDADDTLFDFRKSEKQALCDALAGNGIAHDDDACALYSEINWRYWKMLERGEITKPALKTARFADFFAQLNVNADPEIVSDDYFNALGSYSFLIDGAADFVRELAKNHKLYIVTNGSEIIQTRRFNASILPQYISEMFISEKMGTPKPSKEYFSLVFAAIGNPPKSDIVIIGDSLSSDMQGGANAKIDTIWYNPFALPGGERCTYIAHNYNEILDFVK